MSFNRYTKTFIFVVRMKSSSKEFLKTKVSHPLTKKYSHIHYGIVIYSNIQKVQ